jgi:hypothetical protein
MRIVLCGTMAHGLNPFLTTMARASADHPLELSSSGRMTPISGDRAGNFHRFTRTHPWSPPFRRYAGGMAEDLAPGAAWESRHGGRADFKRKVKSDSAWFPLMAALGYDAADPLSRLERHVAAVAGETGRWFAVPGLPAFDKSGL